ncbi:hypothetical protein HD554DRAFT_1011308 [Boletus coccyginus]|nr:hypothetical protein HD554DRAFT_1011308 [Boletus coccyginus]
MHRALYVEEILRNIFSYIPISFHMCRPFPLVKHPQSQKDILSLVMTCRAFKEPALDILWACLQDLSPLVRCLPEASWVNSEGDYSFNRRLEQGDWDIILGYARRVRALPSLRGSCGLAVDCFEELSKPPSSAVSIFPKLRSVSLTAPWKEISRFVRQLSSLRLTDLYLAKTENLGNTIDAFGEGCPNMVSFRVWAWANSDTISSLICHWPNLYSVNCIQVDLNVSALSHLSHLHNLRYLGFRLHEEVVEWIQSSPSGSSIFTFPALRILRMASRNLASDWKLFHHFRLPVISDLIVSPRAIPTVPELLSYFTVLQETCAHNTLNDFSLILGNSSDFESSSSDSESDDDFPPYYITFDHLRPLTVFANIRSISIDICCGVDLNERELLSLASSWPRLERFSVCDHHHWTPSSGITPSGFVQLLERCKSLRTLYFMFDTRGYTEIPQGHPWNGLTMPKGAFLHFQSSPIEEESIGALAVFFHVAPYPDFGMTTYWDDLDFRDSRTSEELCNLYHDRWVRVGSLSRRLWEEKRTRFLDNVVH